MKKEDLPVIYPNKPSNIIAITGTNGKTSTAWFVQQILNLLNKKCLYVGTIGVSSGNEKEDAELFAQFNVNNLTTPGIFDMHKILSIAKEKADCDFAVIEASSHGIYQGRIDFLNIHSAGFTNFTQDHLDYHKTMDEYFNAKSKLFSHYISEKSFAILNSDDAKFQQIKNICSAKNIISYGKNGDIKLISNDLQKNGRQKIVFEKNQNKYSFYTSILGDFQVYNLLCAIGLVFSFGIEISQIISVIDKITPPLGRLERVSKNGTYLNIYVDYSHTPDALEKAITEVRKITKGKTIVVFGCGGDRDPTKRPIMGEISVKLANYTIITDDNPRTEDAQSIRRQIINGIVSYKQKQMQNLKNKGGKNLLFALQEENVVGNFVEITTGRADAIKFAIEMMEKDDSLLIAGKGHENYQIIGTEKSYFSDVGCVLQN